MHPTFDTAFYKIMNAIGDICERANGLCSRYHDIQKIGGKC